MIPQFLIKPIVWIAILSSALVIGLGIGWSKGVSSEHAKMQARLDETINQYEQEKIVALKKAVAETDRLKQAVAKIDQQRTKELQNANSHIADLRDRLAGGSAVLYVPSTCKSADSGGVPGAADGSGVGDGEARAPLDRHSSEVLLSITGECDQAIIQLNWLQDAVEKIQAHKR